MVLSRAWKSIFNGYFLMGNEAVLPFPFQQEREVTPCRTSSEVPRATCNEHGVRSSPRNLATSAEREVPRAEIRYSRLFS